MRRGQTSGCADCAPKGTFYDWPDEPACLGCVYYRPIYDHGPGRDHAGRICHYILDEGHRRGCPFGPGCTKRRDADGGEPV